MQDTKLDIEITPRMVEAGTKVLWDSGITDAPLGADRELVVEIFRAMVAAQQEEAPRGS
jgi:hypothetical protein